MGSRLVPRPPTSARVHATACRRLVASEAHAVVVGRNETPGRRRPRRRDHTGYPSLVPLYRDSGVVLRTYKLSEVDRIVVILTEHHGKVRAVGKGVRRPGSKFGGRLEPGSHIAVQFREGRELDIVTQAEAVETFAEIRADLDRLSAAATALEVVDHLAQDRSVDRRLYKMTVGVLRTLRDRPSAMVIPAFLLRLLAAEGVGLSADSCVSCGEAAPIVAIDIAQGGGLCNACRSGVAISAEAAAVIAAVGAGRVNEVLAETPASTAHEVEAIAVAAMEAHVDRRLKAGRVVQH